VALVEAICLGRRPVRSETWEGRWATYDEETYARALDFIPPGAVVLDIGAGDLRFAQRAAGRAAVVYALEQRADLLVGRSLPENLIAICGDARELPFPPGIDAAVLLMRHCRHFALYRRKLEAAGCARLITNARWGMGVECIDLTHQGMPFAALALGWYACRCGATGFRAGHPEHITGDLADTIHEVGQCPECMHHGRSSYRLA
jgi:hypothetical protein